MLYKCKVRSLLFEIPSGRIPHGIFTTRLPYRPNPLGLSVFTLLRSKKNILYTKEMDTAGRIIVLGIKPYVPGIDERRNMKIGWLKNFWPHLDSFVE